MKNQYVGDVGDFLKLSLISALRPGRNLGIAWYFNSDDRTSHGSLRKYLKEHVWTTIDAPVFGDMVALNGKPQRLVADLERTAALQGAVFSRRPLSDLPIAVSDRPKWRASWFQNTVRDLKGCDLVLADPDTGLCSDEAFSPSMRENLKHLPLSEASILSAARVAVFYHHHPRQPKLDVVNHWQQRLGHDVIALYCSAGSARTFFIVNPDKEIRERARHWANRFAKHVEIHE